MKKFLNNKKIYIIYTMLFLIISLIVFSDFLKNKTTFIWEADGIKQHYIILKNFNEVIRNFLANPSQGIPLFSWSMGLGLDVIAQYSYCVIGDPFDYISLLFSMEKLDLAYTFLVLLRMFFVGISFIVYARYNNKKDKNILLGAIIYTFCSFALYGGVRHPYFLNAMIFFPMLLLGVDKLLKEDKKVFLCVWVTICAISNYYFFYMQTILIVIYAIIRYICDYRKEGGVKLFLNKLGKAILIYIISVLIASIILIPTIYAFFNSARTDIARLNEYSSKYYSNLFTINLLSTYAENWSCIGVSSIILLMLPILWTRRKCYKVHLIYLIVLTIIILVPLLVSVMNGFSFPNNRWIFGYVFLLSYIITICFDEKYTKIELRNMGIFLGLYSILATALLLIKDNNKSESIIIFLIQLILAFIMFLLIIYKNTKKEANEKISNSFVRFLYNIKIKEILEIKASSETTGNE